MACIGERHPVWESECARGGNPTSTAKLQQPDQRTGKVTERQS